MRESTSTEKPEHFGLMHIFVGQSRKLRSTYKQFGVVRRLHQVLPEKQNGKKPKAK